MSASSGGTNGTPKIGVYICHCGVNIANKVNITETVEFAKTLPYVTVSREYQFMCSDPGQDLIKNDIAGGLIDRVVVASCSPLMHEATFRGATASAGQNPYFMQMANIREHVSWVTADGGKATEKAKALIAGAVRRVVLHVALERKKVGVKSDVLVVGAGIAGIHAALTLANSGKKVYLVEREPSIGGHMAQFDKTFPTLDCSACILTPKMTDVRSHPNIKMMTYSEVQSVSGFIGNFEVEVRRKARYVDEDKCTGCGECTVNCPVRNRISPPEHLEIEPHLDHEVKTWLTNLLEQYKGRAREALLPIMIEVNRQYRYLPRDIIHYMAWRLDIPLSDVALQMATFYNVFSLKPRGLHTIRVCLGTACFVKGSGRLLERLERELGIKTGETTSDLNFTLEAVRCIGCCALAPALRIDGDTYAHVRQDRIPYLLKKYKVEGGVKV